MIIGIDPGKSGALCAMTPDAQIDFVKPLLIVKNGLDVVCMGDLLRVESDSDIVVIEAPFWMPRRAAATQFKMWGQLIGICGATKMPFVNVRPQDWKQVIFRGLDWKNKKTKAGNPIKNDIALQYVRQRFPHVNLRPTEQCKKDSIDMAEAVCIALYGLTTGRPSDD